MENISRRKFIKFGVGLSLLPFSQSFAHTKRKVHIVLPDKPFQYFIKKGKQKGGRVLIVGGIHGNEIGAYKACDLLVETEVERGELILVPRSNFTSILANKRGYNGDMNRKFKHISRNDPDYEFVESLKQLILTYKPDVVLSLHDGYGFNLLNKNHWGQCIVIDENEYRGYPLYKIAKYVADEANKYIKKKKWKLPVYNTQTFSSTKHIEQRKALTGWCLNHDVPAFCLEASKQLPSLKDKIETHFLMIREFLKIYNVSIKPDITYILANLRGFLNKDGYEATLSVDGKIKKVRKFEVIKVPRGKQVKIVGFQGSRGTFSVADDINLNWKSFYIRNYITIHIQDDYKKVFSFRIRAV